jgi:hypothetical protein
MPVGVNPPTKDIGTTDLYLLGDLGSGASK